MTWEKGDVFTCPRPDCACELAVLEAGSERAERPPGCFCGRTMVRKRRPLRPFVI